MNRRATLTIPPDPEAADDLRFFGGTVELDAEQADSALQAAGLIELATAAVPIPTAKGAVGRELIEELAGLGPLEYEQRRKEAGDKLGVRASVLDGLVAAERAQRDKTKELFVEVLPWPMGVNGAELLDEIAATIRRFMVLPKGAAEIIALWLLHAWTHDAFRVSPILAITSPLLRCGKTTLLALLRAFAPRPLPGANITTAAIFRAVEKWRPTLLIDEADTFLRESDELRGVLNSGHTRETACVIRTVGDDHEPRAFSTWAPKAIALIGKLHPTLHDRAIEIRLARKLPGDQVERLRPDLFDGEAVRRRCAKWANDNLAALKQADPQVPPGLNDRAADNWRPLLTIADAAGDSWPSQALEIIDALAAQEGEEDTAGVLLLEDLRALFASRGERILSADLADALSAMEHRPWPEWHHNKPITPRQIARLLRPFGIQPKTIRAADERAKGYEAEQFSDAFSRYLLFIRDTVTTQENKAFPEFTIRDAGKNVTDEFSQKPLEIKPCHGVTDQNPQTWRLKL